MIFFKISGNADAFKNLAQIGLKPDVIAAKADSEIIEARLK